MTDKTPPLPEFACPPVIETVLGVQFLPLQRFSIPHYGLYWARIRRDYPRFELQGPLGQVVESFGPEAVLAEPRARLELVKEPEVRCWFMDARQNRLIQIQNGRFVHNWRRIQSEDVYPRYRNLKPAFVEEWERFRQFLAEEDLGAADVNQCEVTYVNHLEPGEGWNSFGEIDRITPYWGRRGPGSFLPIPEVVALTTRYVMPEGRGRLYISLQPGIRRTDVKQLLVLTLTARGKPDSSSLEGILAWFDLGHEWVVRGFADFASDAMHRIWGRSQ